MKPLKTYSHLAGARRVPTEYEIVTSRLHYYTGRGFEVETPIGPWYERFQVGSPLRCADWEAFRDPRETTYTSYVALQRRKEEYVDGLLSSMAEPSVQIGFATDNVLALSSLRYVWHALQMLAAYVGQMAPGGRITIAAALQAADEMRRVQRAAYRVALARPTWPDVVAAGKEAWLNGPEWQPLRALIEKLLVTWDWGEALVALNVCVKPLLDVVFVTEAGARAKREGDALWGEVLGALDEDCRWQRAWTKALLDVALADDGSRAAADGWVRAWTPAAEAAALAAGALLLDEPALERARSSAAELRREMGGFVG